MKENSCPLKRQSRHFIHFSLARLFRRYKIDAPVSRFYLCAVEKNPFFGIYFFDAKRNRHKKG